MFQKELKLRVSDNSDARLVQCIHINKKKHKNKKTSMGNFVKVTIKKKVSRRKTIKKRINWVFVCATRRKIQRLSGESLRFGKPKITVVDDKQKKIMGTRIKGVIPRELCALDVADIITKARRLI
mgnify:CR=1 FL=1